MTGGAVQKPESECSMPCRGNAAVMCGGSARLSVYTKDMRQLKRDDSHASPARLAKHRRAMHGRSLLGMQPQTLLPVYSSTTVRIL